MQIMSTLAPINTSLQPTSTSTTTTDVGGDFISPTDTTAATAQQQTSLASLQQEKENNVIMTDRNLYNQQQVELFLSQCGLTQYYDTFIEEGFDRLESLLEITETDLIQMQVKRGHRRLVQRTIANAKGLPSNIPLNITPIVSSSNKQQQQQTSTNNNNNNNNYNNNNYNNNNDNMTGYNHNNNKKKLSLSPTRNNNNNSMQPNEAMDVSLQLLAQQAANSPLLSSYTNCPSSTSSSTTSSLSIPNNNISPTTNILSQQQQQHPLLLPPPPPPTANEYFPSAGTMTHSAQSGMSSTEEEAVTSDNVHRLWKRKYHRHAKPDTNAPLKPPSAYVMFSNDVRAELKQQNKSFTDLAKIIGDRWKNITAEEKDLYETNALKSREDYLKKLEEYHKTDSFKKYQQYIFDFKAENEAAARPVGRPRKRHRRDEDKYNSDGTISDSTMPPTNKAAPVASTMIMSTLVENNHQHARTCLLSSDTRHYPFYLLNNEESTANNNTSSPTTLNGPGGGDGGSDEIPPPPTST